MNLRTAFTPLLLAATAMLLSGCLKDTCKQTVTYVTYQPVYKSYEEIRSAVKPEAARALEQPGKIYFKDAYIYISEVNEGIHVINNQDPANPQPVAFIAVPGNHDIAMVGNKLYADSYMDQVVIDVTNPAQAREIGRMENVFSFGDWHPGLWADPNLGIAVDWVETEVTEEWDCANPMPWVFFERNVFSVNDVSAAGVGQFASNSNFTPTSGNGELSTGLSGSMARFAVVGDYLYMVTTSQLIPVNISNPDAPVQGNAQNIGWGIETIFPRGQHLFIGTTTGMLIYSVENPEQPTFVSSFQHANSCDPVVVEGNYAFVTLRNGTECGGFTNQLEVVNIENLASPRLEYVYPMFNPHGLGIRDNVLFICDGTEGLKVYDASDVSKISSNQLAHFQNIQAFDVIPLYNILLMIGADGLYQYDYSDVNNIRQISHIPVVVE